MVLNIQMLRSIAALLVVLHHLKPHYLLAGGSAVALPEIAKWGFLGVDIFFVISGFVISLTVFPKQRDIQSAGTFFRHRLSRIYLGYWPFAFLALLVIPVVGPEKLANVSVFKTLTLTSGKLSQLALPVAWSLSYELYFYLIFGLLFCFSNRVIKNAITVLFVLILSLTLLVDLNPKSNWAFWLSPFILEFLFGVLIFLYRDFLSQRRWLIPSLVLLVVGFWLGTGKPIETDNRVLYFGVSAALLVVLALQLEVNRLFTSPRWLVALGNSSYSLYLSHVLLITAFDISGFRDVLASQPQLLKELGFLGFLVFIVVISHVYYIYVEKPVYRKAIKQRRRTVKPETAT